MRSVSRASSSESRSPFPVPPPNSCLYSPLPILLTASTLPPRPGWDSSKRFLPSGWFPFIQLSSTTHSREPPFPSWVREQLGKKELQPRWGAECLDRPRTTSVWTSCPVISKFAARIPPLECGLLAPLTELSPLGATRTHTLIKWNSRPQRDSLSGVEILTRNALLESQRGS